ncbi:DUF2818 family protein [Roseateles sp. BYS96W]|uniref:DUF2818 family protein n=1 Tax=Pelomonas nitida TaxID=3299027 RepID=A0ABW7G5L8_9BURK
MDQTVAVWLVLAVAIAAANLPYFSERLLFVGPRRAPKAVGWRLMELALMAGLVYGLGSFLEARIGQRSPQGWEFYAAGTCLFITLGFPGFVWRYLRRGRG